MNTIIVGIVPIISGYPFLCHSRRTTVIGQGHRAFYSTWLADGSVTAGLPLDGTGRSVGMCSIFGKKLNSQ